MSLRLGIHLVASGILVASALAAGAQAAVGATATAASASPQAPAQTPALPATPSSFTPTTAANPTASNEADPSSAASTSGVNALPPLDVTSPDVAYRLLAFNTWLKEDVGARSQGYVDSIDDPGTGQVTLLWNGPHGTLLDAVMTEATSIGLTPAVEDWAYNWDQLDNGSRSLVDDQTWFDPSLFTISDVGAMDGSYEGLTVDGDFTDAVSDSQKSDLAAKMTSAAAALTGMNVQINTNAPMAVSATGRSDPASPYRGGSYMTTSDGNVCSTGFSIYDNGDTHAITARHCDESNFTARDNSNTVFSGSNLVFSSAGGAREMGSHGAGSIFTGPQDGPYDHLAVHSSAYDPSLDDELCTDGGNSGNHCPVVVSDTLVQWNDGYSTLNTIKATLAQPHQTIAMIQGDSGGPVYLPDAYPFPYDPPEAYAVGMMQAVVGDQAPDCGNVHDTGPSGPKHNKCSRTLLFTKMSSILNGFSGSTLVHDTW